MNSEDMPFNPIIGFTGDGQRHTLKHSPNQSYQVLRLNDYWAAVSNPQPSPVAKDGTADQHAEAKGSQKWFIPSLYRRHDARSLAAQKADGSYAALWLDDDGSDIDLMAEATEVLGDCYMLVHNTYSDGHPTKGRRRRIVVLLDISQNQLNAYVFAGMQQAFGEAMAAKGAKPDKTAYSASQVSYFGMLGPWAEGPEAAVHVAPLLCIDESHPLAARALELGNAAYDKDRAPSELGSSRKKHTPTWKVHNIFQTEQLMQRYGWEQEHNGKWKAPGQTSQGSTIVEDDGWYGFGDTLASAPVGHKEGNLTKGDNLDLIVWHELIQRRGMQPEPAVALGQQLARAVWYGYTFDLDGDINPSAYLKAMEADGHDLWENCLTIGDGIMTPREAGPGHQKAEALRLASLSKQFEEDVVPTAVKFSHLPEPPWPVNEVAYWIYQDEMVSPNRDIAILTAWAVCAAFAGRKDSFLDNPPVMVATMLAINGVGKDTIKRVLGKLVDQLHFADRVAGTPDHPEARRFAGVDPAHGTDQMRLDELQIVSGLRITSEAGLNKQSRSGDGPKVRAALLQNVAQSAYSRRSYHKAKGAQGVPYGPCVSVIDESTPETYLEAMGGTIGTGEAARNLMVRIDASKVGRTRYLSAGKPVPPHIMKYFSRLLQEAMRDESPEREDGISSLPVERDKRLAYVPSAEVRDRIAQLEEEDTKRRQANTSNEADLEWAQFVRGPQLIFRMALIAARTRALASNAAATVEAVDLQAAEDFVLECRRTERANSSDYEDLYTQAAEALHEWGLRQLNAKTESKTWKKKAQADDKEQRIIRYAVAYDSGTTKAHALIKQIAEQINRPPREAFKLVAETGASLDYWTIDPNLALRFI